LTKAPAQWSAWARSWSRRLAVPEDPVCPGSRA